MILLSLILIFFNISTVAISAYNEQTFYARIMFDQVHFYRSPIDDDSYSNIYFELPKTYFVELVDNCNDLFYKANYSSFTGYVKKDSVQAISGTPSNPYLDNVGFRVYAELSRDLRSEPSSSSKTSSQIAYIPNLSRNLIYYGKAYGETLIDGRTNIWYYCKYSADQNYYGYVYSDFCDELPSVMPNNLEEVSYISNPTFAPPEGNSQAISINDNVVGIIIAIVSLPALVFILMIIKNKKILSVSKINDKEIKDY